MGESRGHKIIKKMLPRRTQVKDLLLGESRVMCRWRSSLWKLIWKELFIYTLVYLLISILYRLVLTEHQQLEFERAIRWCGRQYIGLPVTFLLGFYVSLVVKRWWEQFCKLPWPDNIAILLRGLVQGEGEKPLLVRRTVIRYCILAYILCIRRLSVQLRKRFPTMREILKAGIVRQDEVVRIGEEMCYEVHSSNYWVPIKWSVEIVQKANKEGMIPSAPGYVNLLTTIASYRTALREVDAYGHIPVPLVYTQVVTLAVYFYFLVALIGEQWIIWRKEGDEIELYYPLFLTVKFLFYFGWLRVAETLYNPFGEDDDDFELNELLNRHFRVGMNIVSDSEEAPALEKDLYWGLPDPEIPQNLCVEEDPPGSSECEEITEESKLQAAPHHGSIMLLESRDPMMSSFRASHDKS